MKRSQALKLIANQLDFLNNKFEGMRYNFTVDELSKADVILTTLEHAGIQPPPISTMELFPKTDLIPVEDYLYSCWEPEDEA